MKTLVFIIAALGIAAGAWYLLFGTNAPKSSTSAAPPPAPTPEPVTIAPQSNATVNLMHTVTIKTNFGNIVFEAYDADAPKAAQNFITLAEKGFYNGLTFHRVVSGFMIQGGDPNCNPSTSSGPCGAGGPGYNFEDELNPNTESYRNGYRRGVVAMANAGPNTNGSQFFIMLADTPLPHAYTIFGKVVSGQDVVDAIGRVKTGASDRPIEAVKMLSVSVEKKS